VVEVQCGANFDAALATAESLARQARAVGLEVRANVSDAFAGGTDGANPHLPMVQQAIASLADSGAYTIVLVDSLASAEDDTLREMVRSISMLSLLRMAQLHAPAVTRVEMRSSYSLERAFSTLDLPFEYSLKELSAIAQWRADADRRGFLHGRRG